MKKNIHYYILTFSIILIPICFKKKVKKSVQLITKSSTNVIKNKKHHVVCKVCFTPGKNCTKKIIKQINLAKSEILVQTYSFTSDPIIEALIDQHKKGIKIIVISDYSQANNLKVHKLKNYGITVYIDKPKGTAHNKVIIVDQKVVLTGSFNFSRAAQHSNTENSLTIYSEEMANEYRQNFFDRLKVSKKIEKIKIDPKKKIKTFG